MQQNPYLTFQVHMSCLLGPRQQKLLSNLYFLELDSEVLFVVEEVLICSRDLKILLYLNNAPEVNEKRFKCKLNKIEFRIGFQNTIAFLRSYILLLYQIYLLHSVKCLTIYQ